MSTQTKERPILFSASMILAILGGQKTQTRRIIKKQPDHSSLYIQPMHGRSPDGVEFGDKTHWRIAGPDYPDDSNDDIFCPFGVPGDRLWVREAFQPLWVKDRPGNYKTGDGYKVSYPATDGIQEYMTSDDEWTDRITPSIHMPRWASRITLEITGVRVERLQDISEEDALAEGSYLDRCPCLPRQKDRTPFEVMFSQTGCHIHGTEFKALWKSINGKDSWAKNDWLWVIEFRKL